MPFSCFSPSYTETLPRSHAASNPHSALAQLNADCAASATSVDAGARGRSVDFARATLQGPPKVSMGLSGRVLKRRSTGPAAERRLTKDLIGLPTNFIHEGHAGRPLSGAAAKDLNTSLASVAALLDAPPTLPLAPASPMQSLLPFSDHTNADQSSPSPMRKPSVPGKVARKAPPPVTASVIRQAGPDAVLRSAPPLVPSSPTNFHLPSGQRLLLPVDVQPPGVPSSSVVFGERRESADQRTDNAPQTTSSTIRRADDKWDGTMAEIEAALGL